MSRLHLGCGKVRMEGWIGVDIKDGVDVRSMPFAPGSQKAIYASHVLEHISHRERPFVLKHWVDLLEPGGELYVCVPDITRLAVKWNDANYRTVEQYMAGGHVDENDFHKSFFSEHSLKMAMRQAGCRDPETFEPFVDDCSRWEFSVNVKAVKRDWSIPENPAIFGVFSEPVVGFSDHHRYRRDLLRQIPVQEVPCGGAFWEQTLECGIVGAIGAGADLLLLMDYDTTFEVDDFNKLYETMRSVPDCAAVTGVQMSRHNDKPLVLEDHLDYSRNLTRVTFAHMGLTLVRAQVFKELPRPWFFGVPGVGGWGTAMQSDPDISFWRMMAEYGMPVYWRNDVVLGHIVPMVKFPCDRGVMFVSLRDLARNGKPKQVKFVPEMFQKVAKAAARDTDSQTDPGFEGRTDLVSSDTRSVVAEVRPMVSNEVMAPNPPGVSQLIADTMANGVAKPLEVVPR